MVSKPEKIFQPKGTFHAAISHLSLHDEEIFELVGHLLIRVQGDHHLVLRVLDVLNLPLLKDIYYLAFLMDNQVSCIH